jgi:hypothetical protein
VRSPDLEDTAEDVLIDVASFINAGSELSLGAAAGSQVKSSSLATPRDAEVGLANISLPDAASDVSETKSTWEVSFAAGVAESKVFVELDDESVDAWLFDTTSGAVVPTRMLQAENLLRSSEDAPADYWKAKTAERGLRLYYHAKWLAEHNYARAAEHRYLEAAQLARSSRRNVLASHSLARLGYFFIQWGRHDEAKTVLQESMKLNTKSNPLAPYLHGVLERRTALNNIHSLKIAEDQIMNAGEQPSEDLELERNRLIEEINFWRQAEVSVWQCLSSSDAAHVIICWCGHAARSLREHFLG